MAILVLAAILGLVSAWFLLLGLLLLPASAAPARQLLGLTNPSVESLPVAVELEDGFDQRVGAPFLVVVGGLLQRLTPAGMVQNITMRLDRAGNPQGMSVARYLGLCLVSFVLFTAVAAVFYRSGILDGLLAGMVSGLLFVFGLVAPGNWLQGQIDIRDRMVRRALPDSIDILVTCAEAGLGLDQSIAELVSRRRGPLTDEFDRLLREISLGKSRAQAWRDLAQRAGGADLRIFAAAICQAEELGTSIATVLRVQADSSRQRRSLEIRELASTLPVKMLFPLIFFIFPALFAVVLGPAIVSIYQALTVLGR